jgi:hypothetical protein
VQPQRRLKAVDPLYSKSLPSPPTSAPSDEEAVCKRACELATSPPDVEGGQAMPSSHDNESAMTPTLSIPEMQTVARTEAATSRCSKHIIHVILGTTLYGRCIDEETNT